MVVHIVLLKIVNVNKFYFIKMILRKVVNQNVFLKYKYIIIIDRISSLQIWKKKKI